MELAVASISMVPCDRSSVSRESFFCETVDVQDLDDVQWRDDSFSACVFRTADFCVRPAFIHEADRGELRNSPSSTETSIISRESTHPPNVQLDIMMTRSRGDFEYRSRERSRG